MQLNYKDNNTNIVNQNQAKNKINFRLILMKFSLVFGVFDIQVLLKQNNIIFGRFTY